MSVILAWLTGKIAGPVFAGAWVFTLFTGGAYIAYERLQVSHLTAERDTFRAEIYTPNTGYAARTVACEVNVGTLRMSVSTLNDMINKLADDTKAHDAMLLANMSSLLSKQQSIKASTDRVLALQAPADPAAVCPQAANILKKGAP